MTEHCTKDATVHNAAYHWAPTMSMDGAAYVIFVRLKE